MRLTSLLKSDVDELAKPFARWWTGLLHKHPVAMTAMNLAVYGVLIILAWTFVGPTYGAGALAATLTLYGYGAITAWRRRKRIPR